MADPDPEHRNPNLRQPNRRSAGNPQNPQSEQAPSGGNEGGLPVDDSVPAEKGGGRKR